MLALRRANMVERSGEAWRPPLLSPGTGRVARLGAWARRFLDVQAGSIWRDMAEILPRVRGRVLDVGCGAQPYRPLLSGGVEYLGIDTSDAKAHFGYERPDTRYFSDDVWPVDDRWADLVLATETMEHVPDPRRFLAEAARVMKAGGMLVMTVPFAARWHFIPHDYWRYTPSSLAMLLREAGFENVRVYARGNAVTVACYKAMAIGLSLLMSRRGGVAGRLIRVLLALPILPLLAMLAVVANLSMLGGGGDDCLGYTVLADFGGGRGAA